MSLFSHDFLIAHLQSYTIAYMHIVLTACVSLNDKTSILILGESYWKVVSIDIEYKICVKPFNFLLINTNDAMSNYYINYTKFMESMYVM